MKRAALLLLLFVASAWGQTSVVNTPHNLSISGTGAIHAVTEQEICVFCHTPHRATSVSPLWNRELPAGAYTIYGSRSTDAAIGQPTGNSKLCLSCHDGTIAVGNVLNRSGSIGMVGGMTNLPAGASNLGTDLSDDHPVSFVYNEALTALDAKIKSPALLPEAVKLDGNQEMQCTSCHDAHDNINGNFLVMANDNSQLCGSCHQMGATSITAHQGCGNCHQSHTAPSGPFLLKGSTTTQTCVLCHSGAGGPDQGPNVAADLAKLSNHDTNPLTSLADPIPNDVDCSACHEPHTMNVAVTTAPTIPANFGTVAGVASGGGAVAIAQYEYEVCFKCHAEQSASTPLVSRQIIQANTRLEFNPSAISFHPVQAAGKSGDVPSLLAGWTTASLVYCNDCHNSDASTKVAGAGPDGVHGSTNTPLLLAGYETADNTPESAGAYALCYQCHDRASILGNVSFPQHNLHVVTNNTPCSVCHDAHGISSAQGIADRNSHLINFDTAVVQANGGGDLYFEDRGVRTGACFLNCHAHEHAPSAY